MTNEEYIRAKKRLKFNSIWTVLIKKLPKSSQKSLERNGCAFNSQLYNQKEQFIICRRIISADRYTTKLYMNKSDLEHIFVDYESYLEEIKEYQISARERIDNGLEVYESDINQLERKYDKEVRSLKSEKVYAETLIRLGGGSIKDERELSKLPLYKIGEYIKERRKERKFKHLYFEFKEYGLDKISQVIWRKSKVQDILIESQVAQFVEFCRNQKIEDIYDLMLIPYYSNMLVYEFGAECLQTVINSIKTFIEMQTFELANISFEDLE